MQSDDDIDDFGDRHQGQPLHVFNDCHARPLCPHCGSPRTEQRHLARAVLGTVGTVAGAMGASSRAWIGARAGAYLGAVAGPPGSAIGAVSGAVLAALTGGSAGCMVGTRLGDLVDTSLLRGFQCLECGWRFYLRPVSSR
jgi:hypothetical protein